VLEEERLIQHTAAVGAHLRARLAELSDRHPLIGDVRGRGLLLGVELVLDRASREPATRATEEVVNQMAERGVLIGSAGSDHNVLKIRPPLVFAAEHADRLAGALDDTLRTLDA
jgi:4-aminobutyrate aminotransferase-like enzyme